MYRHSSKRHGLTLIEVMVALGVLVILVSGIFMVVQTSLRTVVLISDRASREDELTNLVDILRSNLRNLPAPARLTAAPVPGKPGEYLFLVRNAPGFMTWLATPGSSDEVVLLSLLRESGDDQWRVCLKRFEPSPHSGELDAPAALKAAAEIPWLELVGGLEKVSVRFFDGERKEWSDLWTNERRRPALIELTIVCEVTSDAFSAVSTFWLPPVRGGES